MIDETELTIVLNHLVGSRWPRTGPAYFGATEYWLPGKDDYESIGVVSHRRGYWFAFPDTQPIRARVCTSSFEAVMWLISELV